MRTRLRALLAISILFSMPAAFAANNTFKHTINITNPSDLGHKSLAFNIKKVAAVDGTTTCSSKTIQPGQTVTCIIKNATSSSVDVTAVRIDLLSAAYQRSPLEGYVYTCHDGIALFGNDLFNGKVSNVTLGKYDPTGFLQAPASSCVHNK